MRSKTSTWFETKIRFDKTVETGETKKITECYVVDAFSFTEAESTIFDEMEDDVIGNLEVKAIKRAPYGEVFFSDIDTDDKFYKAKLQFITIDEKSEKEKKSNVYYLVQASSIEKARKYIDETMSESMIDYSIASITETPVMDVFENKTTEKSKQSI